MGHREGEPGSGPEVQEEFQGRGAGGGRSREGRGCGLAGLGLQVAGWVPEGDCAGGGSGPEPSSGPSPPARPQAEQGLCSRPSSLRPPGLERCNRPFETAGHRCSKDATTVRIWYLCVLGPAVRAEVPDELALREFQGKVSPLRFPRKTPVSSDPAAEHRVLSGRWVDLQPAGGGEEERQARSDGGVPWNRGSKLDFPRPALPPASGRPPLVGQQRRPTRHQPGFWRAR